MFVCYVCPPMAEKTAGSNGLQFGPKMVKQPNDLNGIGAISLKCHLR